MHDGASCSEKSYTEYRRRARPAKVLFPFELVVPLADGGLAHYDRNNDDPSFPWFGPNVFANNLGTFGSVSLIQSNFGSPGNLELVANDEGQLVAFFRDSGPAFHRFGPYEITALN
jgi:hypothetical protein